MDLKIRTVVINYDQNGLVDNVNVGFDSYDTEANLNGNIRLTQAEYDSSSSDLASLAEMVKTKVQDNINE